MRGKDNSVIEDDTVYRTINNRLVPVFYSTSAFHITINRNEGESFIGFKYTIVKALQEAIDNLINQEVII